MAWSWISLIFVRIPIVLPLWVLWRVTGLVSTACEAAIDWIDLYAPAPKRPRWLR